MVLLFSVGVAPSVVNFQVGKGLAGLGPIPPCFMGPQLLQQAMKAGSYG